MNSSRSKMTPAAAARKKSTSTTAANLPTSVEASGIAGASIGARAGRTGTGGLATATRGRAGGGGGSGEDIVGLFGMFVLGGSFAVGFALGVCLVAPIYSMSTNVAPERLAGTGSFAGAGFEAGATAFGASLTRGASLTAGFSGEFPRGITLKVSVILVIYPR